MSVKIRDLVFLLAICFVVFWWRLGALGLIDPDEPFYAQTAREMVQSGDWATPQIFGQPQFEKPIFFYWMTAASFEVFGESEFAARVPSALPGPLTVLLAYLFSARVFSRRAALLSSVIMATGLEFALMSRLMLTDIFLAFFIAGSLYAYWLAMEDERHRNRWVLLHFLCGGMAVLTKGPVASLVTLFATLSFRALSKRPMPYRGWGLWTGLVGYLAISIPWYVIMLVRHGWSFFDAFFIHENIGRMFYAEHPTNNHPFYYLIILFAGAAPWLPLVILTLGRGLASLSPSRTQVRIWYGVLLGFIAVTLVQKFLPLPPVLSLLGLNFLLQPYDLGNGQPMPTAFSLVVLSQLALLWAAWRGAQGRTFDQRRMFLWCWVVTSFVFLTIAQSKLPSYIFYVFVPMAQLAGLELEDLLDRGFRSNAERIPAITLSFVQMLATVAVPFIPIAKPFTVPALMAAACFGMGAVLLALRHYRAWVCVNSLAVAALIIGALIVSLPEVQAYSSAKPVAAAMEAQRQNGEPLLAGKFLARGIHYYTHQPVSVISASNKPFWTDHPLPVVAGKKGIADFLDQNKSAVVTLRRSEWLYWKPLHLTPNDVEPQWWGENGVVRMEKK